MKRILPVVLLLSLLLAACGGSAATPTAAPVATAASEATAAPAPTVAPEATVTPEPTAAPIATPVPDANTSPGASSDTRIITHKYGTTEITGVPERIVTVGLTDQDAVIALGIMPIGTSEWFGGHPGALWPWAQGKIAGATTPELVSNDTGGVNFEKIAALRPDVILALFAGITQEDYDLLSKIAPTVAAPSDVTDYGISWQTLTKTVGTVLDKEAEADTLIADVEAKFEAARAANPEFEGKTALTATPYQGIWVYGREDLRGRFLTSLGFVLPEELDSVTGSSYGGSLSLERADLLNVDAIIWLDPTEADGELGGPVYKTLPVHTEGREVFVDSYNTTVGGATSFVSVLSLPYLIEQMVPRLAAAVDGDPSTAVEPFTE